MSGTIRIPLSVATSLCAELDAGENADTPDSNAAERMAFAQEYMVPTEFARKLERERDEAREVADRCRAALHDAIERPKGVVPESAERFYQTSFPWEAAK